MLENASSFLPQAKAGTAKACARAMTTTAVPSQHLPLACHLPVEPDRVLWTVMDTGRVTQSIRRCRCPGCARSLKTHFKGTSFNRICISAKGKSAFSPESREISRLQTLRSALECDPQEAPLNQLRLHSFMEAENIFCLNSYL